MCPANLLSSQLLHSVIYALLVVGIGAIALLLDRFASMLAAWGASPETVRLIRLAAVGLLGLDVLFFWAAAAWQTSTGLWCLAQAV